MVTAVTLGAANYQTHVPKRAVVQVGGYYYAFYCRSSDRYLVYRSSPDGATWAAEAVASSAALYNSEAGQTKWTVYTDGSYIYIAYSTANTNLTSRRGAPSTGAISWDSAVTVLTAAEYFEPSFTKTAARIWLASTYVSGGSYYIRVWYSTDASSWTTSTTIALSVGSDPGCAITIWPAYSDGIVLVYGRRGDSVWTYYTCDGTSWSGSGTFGAKTVDTYANTAFSLVTANGEVHMARMPSNAAGAIIYYYFASPWSAWSSAATVDSGSCLDPSLTASADWLILFYRIDTTLYYRKMMYGGHSWDAAATTFVSGEAAPTCLTSDQCPEGNQGAVWFDAPTIRFACITGIPTTLEPPISPVAPFMPLFANPVVGAWTPTFCLNEIASFEVRLGSNGAMGSFTFIIPDDEGLACERIALNDPIQIMLRQGSVERPYLGICEAPAHVRSGRRRGNYTKVQGRGYGVYFLRRSKDATYAAQPIRTVITDPATGLASVCSEITFGNYVRDSGVSISTIASKRIIGAVVTECMMMASTATVPWTYWICHGEHAGENDYPNLHFREKSYTPTPIIFTWQDVFSAERVSTLEFLENAVQIEYGSAGATETRNDLTSQGLYGIFYKYVYAPFLSLAAAAQAWGDKWLYGSANPLKAISLTVPMNLFVEPNYTIEYVEPTRDQVYEVSTVTHRGDERGARTIIYAGTTVL